MNDPFVRKLETEKLSDITVVDNLHEDKTVYDRTHVDT